MWILHPSLSPTDIPREICSVYPAPSIGGRIPRYIMRNPLVMKLENTYIFATKKVYNSPKFCPVLGNYLKCSCLTLKSYLCQCIILVAKPHVWRKTYSTHFLCSRLHQIVSVHKSSRFTAECLTFGHLLPALAMLFRPTVATLSHFFSSQVKIGACGTDKPFSR